MSDFTLPEQSENPSGLHRKYNVTKANGEPVDPDAVYFVLRLDRMSAGDQSHVDACHAAAEAYADAIISHKELHPLHDVAVDLLNLISRINEDYDRELNS